MANKAKSVKRASGGPFDSLVDMSIGGLVLTFVIIIAPFIGATVTTMMPAVKPGSSWDTGSTCSGLYGYPNFSCSQNSSTLPNPTMAWSEIITVIILAAVIIVLVVVIAYLRGMGKQ